MAAGTQQPRWLWLGVAVVGLFVLAVVIARQSTSTTTTPQYIAMTERVFAAASLSPERLQQWAVTCRAPRGLHDPRLVFNPFEPHLCAAVSPALAAARPLFEVEPSSLSPSLLTEFTGVRVVPRWDCDESTGPNYASYAPSRGFDCRLHQGMVQIAGRKHGELTKADLEAFQPILPTVDEEYFEWEDLVDSVMEAKGQEYVAIEVGARYGTWAARAYVLARRKHPAMRLRIAMVESLPEYTEWLEEHMRNNNIPPKDYVLFPHFCDASTDKASNTISLADVLADYERVDLLDLDIQSFEGNAVPPAMAVLTRKVRRIHIGVHRLSFHDLFEQLFREHGWIITNNYRIASYSPTPYGHVAFRDGVFSAINPSVV